MGYPSIGSGRGSGVAATLFQKKDGTDAIFSSTGARDAYFRTNPDELKKVGNSPVGIGSADAITAAYVYDKGKANWRAALSNLRGKPGAKGDKGDPGSGGSAKIPPLTSDIISKAIDNGVASDSGSIKGLADGWWVIPAASTRITGRPRGSQGDLNYFKQSMGTAYTVAMAFGTSKEGIPGMWVQYKNAGRWTSWLSITHSDTIDQINSDLAALKLGDAAAVSRIERLETQVGQIYAPSKTLFDTEANGLIDAKLAAYDPPKDPQIAQLQKELDDLKRRVPGTVTPSGGGGVVPLEAKPKIIVMFTNSIPSSIEDVEHVTSATGEARLTRVASTPLRLWALVENDNDEADRVKGISVNKGMEAVWQSRDVVILGKKYRAFYSAGSYTETEVSVKVNFEVL